MVPATAELLPRFLKKYKKSKLKCDETETVQVGGVSWGGVRRRRGHRAGTTGRLVRSRRWCSLVMRMRYRSRAAGLRYLKLFGATHDYSTTGPTFGWRWVQLGGGGAGGRVGPFIHLL